MFTQVSDPVAQGFVTNLAHPGSNITGFAAYEFSLGGKWLDLLRQMVPDLRRAAVMSNPEAAPQFRHFIEAVKAAGQPMGVDVTAAPLHAANDIEPAMARVSQYSNAGLVFPPDSFTNTHHSMIALCTSPERKRKKVLAITSRWRGIPYGGITRSDHA